MKNLLLAERFASQTGRILRHDDGSTELYFEGKVFAQNFYGEQECFTFFLHEPFLAEDCFVMEYSCVGLRRQLAYRQPFVYALCGDEKVPVAVLDDIATDNRRHSLIVSLEPGHYDGLYFEFYIDRRHHASFSLYSLYTCAADEIPVCCAEGITSEAEAFTTLSLENAFNCSYEAIKEENQIDGGRFFDKETVFLHNIPFSIRPQGNNLVAPSAPPVENDEIIDNFGVPVKRKLCRPISRDSVNEVTVNQQGCELFFIAALSGRRHQRWGFASDGTVLGEIVGEVYMPLMVLDTEGFMVEIVYADGRHDTALPYNLSRGRYGVIGDVGVYVVPTDGSKIEKIVFHNKMLDTDCSIAAVTLNQTAERLLPRLMLPQTAKPIECKVEQRRCITLQGDRLTVKNGSIEAEFDTAAGLRLLKLKNGWIPVASHRADSVLKLREADGTLSDNFETVSVECETKSVLVRLKNDAMYFNVTLCIEEENTIQWQLSVTNNGNETFTKGIVFPCVSGLLYQNQADSWYFFPKYQNINSNETVFMYEESAPTFPMQFFDVYSPAQQGGLSVTTRERECLTRIYALEKDENGISFFVEYPHVYSHIEPDSVFNGSPTSFTAHSGDWHFAFKQYTDWLAGWYEPHDAQDKQWYRECFWLLTEYSDFVVEDVKICKYPTWYDSTTNHFTFNDILEEQKSITGCYPDILHLWSSWMYIMRDGKHTARWGNNGGVDYDNYGGAENLKQALHNVIDKKGVQISLYYHPTLLSATYPELRHFYDTALAENDIGDTIKIGEDTYRMCHANEEWREHAIEVFRKAYEDLKIPLLYVDEFSLRIENRCYAKNHGHSVPSNLLQTDRDFITRLKEVMPKEVVLYGEYTAVDIYAGYIDCNISYYVTDNVVDMVETSWRADDGDDSLGRVYLNLYRFAFPKIVQLILPSAMRHLSWHPQKFIFFNGEAVYDSFWDCEESAGLAYQVRAQKLKKQYADCFTSDHPMPLVQTLTPAVCANCFPGKGRTLYTLYNRAYATYRGTLLSVPHQSGNCYYDAWNDRELSYELYDGKAILNIEIDALQVGCIVIEENR